MDFRKVLAKNRRVAVVGGPVTGKSALTEQVTDRPVIQSDDIPWGEGFSAHSKAVMDACEGLESFVVSGVAADRAIRKGLEVDVIIHCDRPQTRYRPGQATLKRQVDKRVAGLKRSGLQVLKYSHGKG